MSKTCEEMRQQNVQSQRLVVCLHPGDDHIQRKRRRPQRTNSPGVVEFFWGREVGLRGHQERWGGEGGVAVAAREPGSYILPQTVSGSMGTGTALMPESWQSHTIGSRIASSLVIVISKSPPFYGFWNSKAGYPAPPQCRAYFGVRIVFPCIHSTCAHSCSPLCVAHLGMTWGS